MLRFERIARLQVFGCLAAAMVLAATSAASAQISVGDLVAGGNGKGEANPEFPSDLFPYPAAGIAWDTGLFEPQRLFGNLDLDGFLEAAESPFIDGVIGFSSELEQINSDNVMWSMEGDDRHGDGGIYDLGMANAEAGSDADGPADENDRPELQTGIRVADAEFDNGVGIHASAGITFNLDELRAAFPGEVNYFSAFAGDANGFCNNQGELNAYVVLSDSNGVLAATRLGRYQDTAEFFQIDLSGAKYLTLAIGAGGVVNSPCDNGAFADAQITAEPVPTPGPPVSVRFTVANLTVNLNESRQLKLLGELADGTLINASAAATGTTYTSSNDAIATVSADGVVSGVGIGDVTVTAENNGQTATVPINVIPILDLGDMIAGGDGTGTGTFIGLNADTGEFVAQRIGDDVPDNDFINPQMVPDSGFIDSVFIMNEAFLTITSTGVMFTFNSEDTADGWEAILDAREPGGADEMTIASESLDNPDIRTFEGIGLHAAQGVTFDLQAIRNAHGADAVRSFQSIAGECSTGCPIIADDPNVAADVRPYVIVSTETEVIQVFVGELHIDSFQEVVMPLPDEARFLTLAMGSADNDIGCDHGCFPDAFIVGGVTEQDPTTELSVDPSAALVAVGGTRRVLPFARLTSGLRVAVPENSTFVSSNPDVATVDAGGAVTGVAPGMVTIEVTFDDPVSGNSFTASALIEVGGLDLGDIVSAGDGTGDKLPIFDELLQQTGEPVIGVDQDLGLFQTVRIEEGVPDTDGINPIAMDGCNATDDSPWIDSVFVMTDDSMAINSSGVSFDFASGDANAEGWEFILDGREPGGPDNLTIGPTSSTDGVGIHASAGITYNLDELRATHGDDAINQLFTAFAGTPSGSVTLYAILSDDSSVIDSASSGPHSGSGAAIELPIPPEAKFLTLAAGDAGDGIGSDHGMFIEARISATGLLDLIRSHEFVAPPANLIAGSTGQAGVSGILPTRGDLRIDVTGEANVTFESSNPAVATVGNDGVVTAIAPGTAEISGMVDGELIGSAEVNVKVLPNEGPGFLVETWQNDPVDNDLANVIPYIESNPRTDAAISQTINFVDSGGGHARSATVPFPAMPPPENDNFSVRITGFVMVENLDPITFGLIHDDGFRLRIDGVDIFQTNVWDGDATGTATPLDLPQWTPPRTGCLPFELVMTEGGGGAYIELTQLVGGEHVLVNDVTDQRTLRAFLDENCTAPPPPDVLIDFDTSGPTSTAQISDFFDLFGFDAMTGAPGWEINPNVANPGNPSNALHITSDGEQLTTAFSRVAILKASEFEGENMEVSAEITWDDASGDANDFAGVYARFVDEDNWYYLVIDAGDAGNAADGVSLWRSKNGEQTELVAGAASPVPIGEGDVAKVALRVAGNQISAFINEIPVLGIDPFVDSDPVTGAGRVGVGEQTNPAFYDNLAIRVVEVMEVPPTFVNVMGGLGSAADTFISPLGEDVMFDTFGLTMSEDLTDLTAVVAGYTGPGQAPTVSSFTADGGGNHTVQLDRPIEPGNCLRLTLTATGAGGSSTFDVVLAHQPLDVNQDGVTNIRDATGFGDVFRSTQEARLIDINGDGIVDVRDATAFGSNWNGVGVSQAWRNTNLAACP